MPITAFLHTHVLVVILFLILFIIKAFLLFTNKLQALETIKRILWAMPNIGFNVRLGKFHHDKK